MSSRKSKLETAPPASQKSNPVLTLSAVTGFEYDGSRAKLSSAPTKDDAHYWLEKGELMITRSNTTKLVGHVAIFNGTPSTAICCDLIMKMKVDPTKATTRFVYFFLRSPEARDYLMMKAHGASSTMKKIGKQVVQEVGAPVPPLDEQANAVAALDQLALLVRRLETIYTQKLANLDELKQSLLQKAFTGQLTMASDEVCV